MAINIASPGESADTLFDALHAVINRGDTLVAASTTDLSTVSARYVTVTGNTTITGWGTAPAGTERMVKFTGTPQVTHNATSNIMPGGASRTMAAGDVFTFRSLGSGNWECIAHQLADGRPLVQQNLDAIALIAAIDAQIGTSWRASADPIYNYYVNGDTGSDSNDGTVGSPFATLAKLAQAMAANDSDTTTTALIAADDYLDDQFYPQISGKSGMVFELTFEEGCTLQSGDTIEAGGGNGQTGINSGGGMTIIVNGNGLTVSGFHYSSGNGLGSASGGLIYCYDVDVEDCDDGFSLHGDAYGELHRGTISNCLKACVAHVNTSSSKHYDCTFVGDYAGTMTGGLVITEGPNRHEFHRCTVTPVGSNIGIGHTDGVGALDVLHDECVLGTLAASVSITTNQATGLEITNSFVNSAFDARQDVIFDECYGYLSIRHRNGGGTQGVVMTNCVWGGGASGATDSLMYANFDPSTGSKFTATDCVIVGYGTAMGGSFNATFAQQFIDGPAEVTYCLFHDNSTDIDADLIADDGYAAAFTDNVTGSDPLLGAMDSTDKADWGYGVGSPCIGAGSGGGNIGFAAS